MSERNELPSAVNASPVVAVVRDDVDPVEAPPANPLTQLQVLLYGRYLHAAILGVLLAICGAAAAWRLTPPKFEIVGYVRVKPYIPKVLYQSEENGMLPSFDTFVDLQESLLQGERVLNQAGLKPEWIAIHRKSPDTNSPAVSVDALAVEHAKGSELITVTATDRDVNAASAAVKCILKAYLEISSETEGAGDANRLKALEDLRTRLSNQLADSHARISEIATQYGTDNLEQEHQLKAEESYRLESELQAADLELSRTPADSAATTSPTTAPESVPLTRAEVAQLDPRMRDYIAEETRLTLELDRLRARLGDESGNNTDVKTAANEFSRIEDHINSIMAEQQTKMDREGVAAGLDAHHGKLTTAELRVQRERIRMLYEKAHADALDLGRKNLRLIDLKDEESSLKKKLEEATTALEQHDLESRMVGPGRISILSEGEVPNTPPKNKRAVATAAACIGGFGAGVGLIAVWGFLDRRARSVMHVHQLEPSIRMLGVLPILPDKLEDADQKSMAALCVHQIRNLLDSNINGGSRTLAITSPSAGDGKTSLSLALGLSFSAAGSRTLLIDCDMVGGGLTSRLMEISADDIGTVLDLDGLLTESQLKEAKALAESSGREVQDVLIELGYINPEDVGSKELAHKSAQRGLLDALDGIPLMSCVSQVITKNLHLLPLGNAAAHHTNRLSPKAFRRILSDARAQYDIILVDTGPILGSLEASIVVREVDEVVLTIARNSQSQLIKHSIKRLDALQVRCAGLVFNRANPADVAFSHYGSSQNHSSLGSAPAQENGVIAGSPRRQRLDSLSAAVVVSGPLSKPLNGFNSEDPDHDAA